MKSVSDESSRLKQVYADSWPLYVNDSGVVSCGRCGDDASEWMLAARRRTVRELMGALAVHAAERHHERLVEREERGDDEAE